MNDLIFKIFMTIIVSLFGLCCIGLGFWGTWGATLWRIAGIGVLGTVFIGIFFIIWAE